MKFIYHIVVPDANDPENGHQVLEWLFEQDKKPDRDFDLDMHGGQVGFTSFYFKDRILAIRTRLMWG